jgi:hypothetical protein
MNKLNPPVIVILEARERELLFASLYLRHGMWSESFIVGNEGQISPNPKWWRQRKIFQKTRIAAVLHFCNGWIAGRKAQAIEQEASELAGAPRLAEPMKITTH